MGKTNLFPLTRAFRSVAKVAILIGESRYIGILVYDSEDWYFAILEVSLKVGILYVKWSLN